MWKSLRKSCLDPRRRPCDVAFIFVLRNGQILGKCIDHIEITRLLFLEISNPWISPMLIEEDSKREGDEDRRNWIVYLQWVGEECVFHSRPTEERPCHRQDEHERYVCLSTLIRESTAGVPNVCAKNSLVDLAKYDATLLLSHLLFLSLNAKHCLWHRSLLAWCFIYCLINTIHIHCH